jgi:2-polyprenyl-3-methyl-5-hydroxy-6-metoxy-1,4-benzoquinol methylase
MTKNLDAEGFNVYKQRALDESLQGCEKIGFTPPYRDGFEDEILKDMADALLLDEPGKIVMDIGCGCGVLSNKIQDYCLQRGHSIVLIDSVEMLSCLPERKGVTKVGCQFPNDGVISHLESSGQAIIINSVIQSVLVDMNPYNFLDAAIKCLSVSGRLFLGDVPNISRSNRISDCRPMTNKVDDAIIFSILMRYRNLGYETYLLPQSRKLPLHKTRENILIERVK